MFQNVPLKLSTTFHNQELSLETGLLAGQATASVVATIGETTVMANVVVGKADMKIDYFPLQVIYEEKMYASGKIRGSRFEKREGRPSDSAILAGRAVDRSLRSLFNEDFRNSVQVIVTVLSVDEINPPDTLAILAGSVALSLATKDFQGPVSGVRVGLIGTDFVINPSYAQMIESSLDLVISGDGDNIMMLEAGANIITEEVIGDCLDVACEELKVLTQFQNNFVAQAQVLGLAKQVALTSSSVESHYYAYWSDFEHLIENILYSDNDKETKNDELNKLEKQHREALQLAKKYKTTLNQELRTKLEESYPSLTQSVLNLIEIDQVINEADENLYKAFHATIKKIVQRNILDHNKRVDGRELDQTRLITSQIDVLPRVHGSSLFSRGETQVMNILTLGTLRDALTLDGMEEFSMEEKRYLHHYNFPSYSVGETGRYGSPSRREIGHGALAERALLPVIPTENEFPYTMRLVSECLGSNGSTSMASTCASTLSLMAGGVPIKAMVAGVAMGLVLERPTNNLGDLSEVKLETERLTLRTVKLEDAELVTPLITDKVTQYLEFETYCDVSKSESYIQAMLPKIQNGQTLILSVFEKQSNKFIGYVSAFGLDTTDNITIGVWVGEQFWGNGYGFEMVSAVKSWLDSNLKYGRMIYKVHPDNTASRKIAEKLGGTLLDQKFFGIKEGKQVIDYVGYDIQGNYSPNHKTLTDIQGLEDHLGDMDFKVTGTDTGVTAIQLDNKVAGLTPSILKQALLEAKKGRLHILDVMKQCITEPKSTMSQYAPVVASLDVPLSKIGDVIGGGGKIIRGIEERFGTKVDLDNDTGKTFIYGKDMAIVQECKEYIESLIITYEIGQKFSVKVLRIVPFGAFVGLVGSNQEGMIHISKFSTKRIDKVEDVANIGDILEATISEIKPNGNIALSLI